MKKICLLAALLMASTASHAGDSIAFQIGGHKIRVEAPDDVDISEAPQNRGAWNSESKILMRSHPVPRPAQQLPPDGDYANPDGPTDTA